jgi:hypothetical protein
MCNPPRLTGIVVVGILEAEMAGAGARAPPEMNGKYVRLAAA